ncbi:putative fungistatic metabolite [Neolecta irregularis DAH-3]|uniref:Putative fungistatic metabolite n=1 Tax=Neolecta irregularis (strain DAH-3) TaxID=1198029 RepID=A0A1U7LS57_NEOID|nr:putative fungistatic metabolite [Neolecta irregularis DAH-3]|eukprot:OLL25351.1 putative fungistatic metabolite [Neolecta irregularis DAH-3]
MSLSRISLYLLSSLHIVAIGGSNTLKRRGEVPADWTFAGCATNDNFDSAIAVPMITAQCFVECREARTYYAGFGIRCFCTSANITISSCASVEGTVGWVSVFEKTGQSLSQFSILSDPNPTTLSPSKGITVPEASQTQDNSSITVSEVSQTQDKPHDTVTQAVPVSTTPSELVADSSTRNSTSSTETLAHVLRVAEIEGRTALGCYVDTAVPTSLEFMSSSIVSVPECSNLCSDFDYMGLEYGGECFCGNDLHSGTVKAPDKRCFMTCVMTPGTNCGGPAFLMLYNKTI